MRRKAKRKPRNQPRLPQPRHPQPAPATTAAAPELPSYFAPDPAAKGSPWPDATGAAAGAWITPSSDTAGGGDVPSTQTITSLYDRVAHNMISINHVWVLVAGFLVMFMQAGFAAVEAGLCRVKNSAHTMTMNMMIYPLGCIAFYVYGFALGWGNWWNGPVAPGWYPSLGPGLSLLNGGWGIGAHGRPERFQLRHHGHQRLVPDREWKTSAC